VTPAYRPRVFIEYSHRDERWLTRLRQHFAPLEREGLLEIWSDSRIELGADWRAEIQQAIESASVAILLISADFLASDFILGQEIPALLHRQMRGHLRIVPVILRSSPWQELPWLADIQVFPRGGKPLSTLSESEVDATLAALASEVLTLVRQSSAAAAQAGSWAVGGVRLKNVRGFEDFSIDLRDDRGRPRQRTLVIGRNGTCKTTLLRAIALSLCDPVDADALIAEPIGSLVGDRGDAGEIEVLLTQRNGEAQLLLQQELWHAEGRDSLRDRTLQRPAAGLFVCAYGAGRYGVGTDTGREYRIRDSVATLFDYRQTLIDAELTLRRLQDFLGTERFTSTLLGIRRVLGLTPDDEIYLAKGGGVEISGPTLGRKIRLEGWADGYRLTFSWLLDLYGWAMRADRVTSAGGIEGIVLVDELEQHLHPSMQTQVLPRLTEILPDLQVFATTHSPLIALGVAPEELISLHREGDAVIAERRVPDFTNYSAEDMLVDDRLFASDAYGPETSGKLHRYRNLVQIPPAERNAEERRELEQLGTELRAQQLPEVREEPAARELREIVARHGL
jgi:hypothetical protein